ncbi:hypothetical protein V866_008524 [Kwoniella sp. B9012]|uniref:Ricin B lectin domain-containing protein n=1 Tax=Kwoniella europaea PYCC6329 TaxID=1423913 RepID=A0AAX4KXI5_9TREE
MFSKLTAVLLLLGSTSTFVSSLPTSLIPRQSKAPSGWADGYYIAAVGQDKKCLAPAQSPAVEGIEIIATDCRNASTWRVPIQSSGGAVVHEKSQLVLDFGEGQSGSKVTLQNFTGKVEKQIFHYGSDDRLRIENGTKWPVDRCLDLGDDGPQVYQCFPDNTNQVWVIRQTPEPKNLTEGVPQGSEVAVQDSNLNFIHPQDRKDICVSAVSNSTAQASQGIAFTYCAGTGFAGSGYNTSHELMEWSLPGSGAGQVKLGSSNLCLETGANVWVDDAGGSEIPYFKVQNGMEIRLEECDENRTGQSWSWDGQLLRTSANANQCLNFAAEAGYVKMDNFLNLRPLQTWDCSNPDGQFVS